MSDLGAYIELMMEKGFSLSEASKIVAEIYGAGLASAPFRKSPAALRQKAYRDRKKGVTKHNESVTPLQTDERNETVTNRNESVTRYASPTIEDKLDTKKVSRPPTSRGTRIPPDWSPTDEDLAFAKGEGLSEVEIDREAGKFRDYWLSKSGRDAAKITWSGTWRVWIRNHVDRRGGKPAAPVASVDKLDHEAALKIYIKTGVWSRHAPCPEPGHLGCTVPPEMFEKYGLLPDGRKAA